MTELKFRRMIMSMIVMVGMFLMIGVVGMTDVKIKSKPVPRERVRQVIKQENSEDALEFKEMIKIQPIEAKPLITIK